MERELYRVACEALDRIPMHRKSGQTYSDHDVVRVLLWTACHDRPVCWACQLNNWPLWRRRTKLISQSQMSRRLRTVPAHQLLTQLGSDLRDRLPQGLIKYLDAKPLPVGGASKDRDAKFGRGAAGVQRGYKVTTAVDQYGCIEAWQLGPMNLPEHQQAEILLERMPWGLYVVGDNAYDKTHLYQQADARGMCLIGAFKTHAKAPGHRRQSPQRQHSLDLQRRPFGQDLLRMRWGIERSYGQMCSFAGGLAPLPAWVRTPHRVAVWFAAKLILDLPRRKRRAGRSCRDRNPDAVPARGPWLHANSRRPRRPLHEGRFLTANPPARYHACPAAMVQAGSSWCVIGALRTMAAHDPAWSLR